MNGAGLLNACGSAPARRTARPRSRRAFTLIETAMALVIIGVGVLALIDAQQSFIKSNGWSTHAATGTYLANEIREMTRRLPKHDPVTGLYINSGGVVGWGADPGEVGVGDYDDIDDLDGLVLAFNGTPGREDDDLPGPVDAFGNLIPAIDNDGTIQTDDDGNQVPLFGWSQRIDVQKVDPIDFATVYPNDHVLPSDGPSGFRGLAVNEFPLRVTVTVFYQGPFDAQASTVAAVTWIVP